MSEIKLTLLAWQKAKLWALEARRRFRSEVGMFGLVSATDPLLIEDVFLSSQEASCIHFDMDEASHARTLDALDAAGVDVARLNAWVHSHPGTGKQSPSGTDLNTIHRLLTRGHLLTVILDEAGDPGYGRVDVAYPAVAVLADVVQLEPELPESERVAALAQFAKAVRPPVPRALGSTDPLVALFRRGNAKRDGVEVLGTSPRSMVPELAPWEWADSDSSTADEEDQLAIRVQSGLLDQAAAETELISLDYTPDEARQLIRNWVEGS